MTAQKNAAILIIGNEILAGHTIDANIPFLAGQLNRIGIRLAEARVIPDIKPEIIFAVNECRKKYDYVFTTGGIGPTHDDITAESVAAAFDTEFGEHPLAIQILQSYYQRQNIEITPARRRMAMMPLSAHLIPNPISHLPGFYLENVYVMAGVPNIMQAMFKSIESKLTGGAPILTRAVLCRLLEGVIADDLSDVQKKYPEIDIGSYPSFRSGQFVLKLVLRGQNSRQLAAAVADIVEMAQKHGDNSPQIEEW